MDKLPDLSAYQDKAIEIFQTILVWLQSPPFWAQIAGIVFAWFIARFVAAQLRKRVPFLHTAPQPGRLFFLRDMIYRARELVQPLLLVAIFRHCCCSFGCRHRKFLAGKDRSKSFFGFSSEKRHRAVRTCPGASKHHQTGRAAKRIDDGVWCFRCLHRLTSIRLLFSWAIFASQHCFSSSQRYLVL